MNSDLYSLVYGLDIDLNQHHNKHGIVIVSDCNMLQLTPFCKYL